MLTKDNLDSISAPIDLLKETHHFYKTLYSANQHDEQACTDFLNIQTLQLTTGERTSCKEQLNENKLLEALSAMENNKSPGVDGLTTNFCKHFWPLLGTKLTCVFNYALRAGSLSVTQCRGIITLVFKKGDRTRLKNWQPITLLTTDYKILTKTLANWLKKVLPTITHSDQTACVPLRTINDNVTLIRDAIHYANETNTPLALISIDQLKAFDRVSHDFLSKVLHKFSFGPVFQQWIKTIYNNICSSVKVNGLFTAFIDLKCGLRQGCALSLPLYILTAEILTTLIRLNPNIQWTPVS